MNVRFDTQFFEGERADGTVYFYVEGIFLGKLYRYMVDFESEEQADEFARKMYKLFGRGFEMNLKIWGVINPYDMTTDDWSFYRDELGWVVKHSNMFKKWFEERDFNRDDFYNRQL